MLNVYEYISDVSELVSPIESGKHYPTPWRIVGDIIDQWYYDAHHDIQITNFKQLSRSSWKWSLQDYESGEEVGTISCSGSSNIDFRLADDQLISRVICKHVPVLVGDKIIIQPELDKEELTSALNRLVDIIEE